MSSLVEISKGAAGFGRFLREYGPDVARGAVTTGMDLGVPAASVYMRAGARRNLALAHEADEMTEALGSAISRVKKRNKIVGRAAAGTAGVAALNAARPKRRKKTEQTEAVLTKSVLGRVVGSPNTPVVLGALLSAHSLRSARKMSRAAASRRRNSEEALAQTMERAVRARKRGMATTAGAAGAGAALVGSTQTRKRDR